VALYEEPQFPGPPPAPEEQAARALAPGFIEAHRQKIFLGLSVAGTLLLGPFAVNNFFQGRLILGVATCAFLVCLLANTVAIGLGRLPVVPAGAIFVASAIGLGTAMYNNGLIGILWVYPGLLLFHFMLPRRTANILNLSLVMLAIPLAWMHLGAPMAARVGVTMVLLVVFTNIFSHIADTQQAKEAEQREHLDALVRQLEDQNKALREAFRMREEVERIARHDLKTPLASIASVPRLLRERHPPDPEEDELLGTVERAALRVLSMVNLSLDLFRMEEGSYRLRAQAVDLAAHVNTVVRELQAHARSKNVRMVADLPPEPVYAQGEDLLCYSTIANLLKNALEASPDDADVRVTLRRVSDDNGDAVALDIDNAGEMPESVRERFFEKYATHGKRGGTGLGAYSARLMARVQRGSLRMTSGPEGTTLALRLPLWHAAPPVQVAPGRAPEIGPAQQQALPELSVLLVDDDEYNIVVLKSLLPSPPLVVRTAVNGRAALQLVREQRPDVIFLDIEMPVMGGIEAAHEIRGWQREHGESPSLIAAFSAHDDDATRRQCLGAGFDLYLAKPASREEVFAVLRGQDPVQAATPAALAGSPGDRRVWIEPGLMPLMPAFLSSRRDLADELSAAAAQGDRETIRATAHKLAGSLAMYGFKEASRASRALEQAAACEQAGELRERCAALVDLLARAEPVARPVAS
jgi:signal transduction histidine kinase/DNA-binding response OmpR family regulator